MEKNHKPVFKFRHIQQWLPFESSKAFPESGNEWAFNICYTTKQGEVAFSSMLGAVGAPARFGKIVF